MSKKHTAHVCASPVTDFDPINEAIERLSSAALGLVCLQELMEGAESLDDIDGIKLTALMRPHVSELDAVLGELRAFDAQRGKRGGDDD